MRRGEIFVMVVVGLVLALVLVGVLMPSDKGQEKVATVATNPNPSAVIPDDSTTSTPAPEVTTAEPETEKPLESTGKVTYTDEDGKTYFVGDGALQVALDSNLQQRMDYAVISSLRVYDVVRDTDVVVQKQGMTVTSRYDLLDSAIPQKVEILRDGYKILAWSEDLSRDENRDKTFATAEDAYFTAKVFCKEHKAVFSIKDVAYVNMEQGFRGKFATAVLDRGLFDAWVLVARDVELEGQVVRALTWCLNTCECEGTKSDGGKKPVKDPTKAPTTPTPAPTEAPTTPTPAPTEAPTPTPDNNPKATVRPTDPVGDNNPRATVKPTDEAPVVTDGDNNGRPDSPVDGGRPTIKPSSDDTGADGSNAGWSEDLPKIDPGF